MAYFIDSIKKFAARLAASDAWKLSGVDIVFLISFCCLASYYWERCRLGLPHMDESFYAAQALRLLNGDCLIINEWHLSQLSSILTSKFLELALLIINGSEDGILLVLRHIYVSLHLFVVLCTYLVLRKRCEAKLVAVAVSLMYGMFIPYNIMAPCYNSLGLMTVWIFCLCVTNSERTEWNIVAGVALACAILCCPCLLILFILYTAAVLVYAWRKNPILSIFSTKRWLGVSIGACIVFVYFCIVLFTNPAFNFESFMQNLPYCISDGEHDFKGFLEFIYPVYSLICKYVIFVAIVILCCVVSLACKRLRPYLLIVMYLLALIGVGFTIKVTLLNRVMLPMAVIGGFAFFMSKRKDWTLFIGGWCTSVAYASALSYGSNQMSFAISAGGAVAACFSPCFVYNLLAEKIPNSRARNGMFAALLILQLIGQGSVLSNCVFWDDADNCKNKVDSGCCAGTYTSAGNAEESRHHLENIRSLNIRPGQHVLFIGYPAGYLQCNSAIVGGYSPWSDEGLINSTRFPSYYTLHPDRIPEVIYVVKNMTTATNSEGVRRCYERWCEQSGYDMVDFGDNHYAFILKDYSKAQKYWYKQQ